MFRTDFKLVTKSKIPQYINAKNLNYFDAVMFFTQGDFPLSEDQRADLLSFVREDGKGILVAHSGTDHNRWEFTGNRNMAIKNQGGWPEFTEMIGGVFVNHPWLQPVRINVEDRGFPATEHFPAVIEIEEEIYQVVKFSRKKVRVLMTLDVDSVDLENPPLGACPSIQNPAGSTAGLLVNRMSLCGRDTQAMILKLPTLMATRRGSGLRNV